MRTLKEYGTKEVNVEGVEDKMSLFCADRSMFRQSFLAIIAPDVKALHSKLQQRSLMASQPSALKADFAT